MGTFYEYLGVDASIPQEDLKKAMKRKALACHPDKHPPDEKEYWTEKFQFLTKVMETFQDEGSRGVYDEKYLRKERDVRVLILMDMNGSLLCKLGTDGKDGRPPPGAGRAHFSDKHNNFWVRPYAEEFLHSMLDSNLKIAFAIYTSRELKNAEPQVTNLFDHANARKLRPRVFEVFAGEKYSVPDPAAGPYKSKRSLRRIWASPACTRMGVKFDQCSTVNLDNEASKLVEHPDNGIVVPSYGARQLGSEDRTLLDLREYLLGLAQDSHGDVRAYMKVNPFGGVRKLRAIPPPEDFEENEEGEVEKVAQELGDLTLSCDPGQKGPGADIPKAPNP